MAKYPDLIGYGLGFETAGEILREKRATRIRRNRIRCEGLLAGARRHLEFTQAQMKAMQEGGRR